MPTIKSGSSLADTRALTLKPRNLRDEHPDRHPLRSHSPREEVITDFSVDAKRCDDSRGFLSLIWAEKQEQWDTVCLKFVVKKRKRLRYACRCCQGTILLAASPHEAIEKGITGLQLLAQVLFNKYGDHLSLYCPQQQFKRYGLTLSLAMLWNWIHVSVLGHEPLVKLMAEGLLALSHVFASESPMPTLGGRGWQNLDQQAKKNYSGAYTRLQEMVEKIGRLYELERKLKGGASVGQIAQAHQERALLILTQIHEVLAHHQPQIPPKGLLDQRNSCTLSNSWQALIRYVQDRRLETNNNRSERWLKIVVIGRKNSLFMGGELGVKAVATLYSLTGADKHSGVALLTYQADAFQKIPPNPNQQTQDLIPYNLMKIGTQCA